MTEKTQKAPVAAGRSSSAGKARLVKAAAKKPVAKKPAAKRTTGTRTTGTKAGASRTARPGAKRTNAARQNARRSNNNRGGGGNRGGGNRRRGGRGNVKNISKNWKKAKTVGPLGSAAAVAPKPSKNGPQLRVAVVGGAEEVGRNMTMIEYGDDIILIDAGLQFPDEDMPGVDYIIPNMSYFKGKEKNIKGVIITHAHYDHIGAIPHIMPALHNPPIYSARLSLGIIAKRQTDFPGLPELDLREIDIDGQIQMGQFIVEFVRINHSIPDSLAIVVRTPEGIVLHTGDFKFDLQPIGDQVTDFAKLTRLGQEGVLALLADSTNASKPGQQKSETYIGNTIKEIMEKADGRIIVGTFASNLNRVQQLLWSAEELGRHVVLEGYSMRTNVEIAKELGYLTVKNNTIVSPHEGAKLPDHKVVIVGTGAQGEERASMMRMATGEHRFFNVQRGDMVIFSSSVIPGNERSVQYLKDMMISKGANMIHYQMMDVHAGGHAQAEDLKLLIRMIEPKYYVPIEGNLHLLWDNGMLARQLGWGEDEVFITSNGQVMAFKDGKGVLTTEKFPSDYVFVDGLGVGDVSEVVLRDRQHLAEDGMMVVIVTVDHKTSEVIGEPDIISRGFIYMKGNNKLINDVKKEAASIVKPHLDGTGVNATHLKNKLRDELGEFVHKQIQRRPMVMPVIVEV